MKKLINITKIKNTLAFDRAVLKFFKKYKDNVEFITFNVEPCSQTDAQVTLEFRLDDHVIKLEQKIIVDRTWYDRVPFTKNSYQKWCKETILHILESKTFTINTEINKLTRKVATISRGSKIVKFEFMGEEHSHQFQEDDEWDSFIASDKLTYDIHLDVNDYMDFVVYPLKDVDGDLTIDMDAEPTSYRLVEVEEEKVITVKENQKKRDIELTLYRLFNAMFMDKPENFDEILEFCYNDVSETADENNWSDGDVVIAFRRWIEHERQL